MLPAAAGGPVPPIEGALVVEFARALRASARAVAFYPPSHPAVGAALGQLVQAGRALTRHGPRCLTILPNGVLAGAAPVESDCAVLDLAALLHRHGIGALTVNAGTTAEGWRHLLTLVSRPPAEVRAAGGIERQWKQTGHASPSILEIDFGDLLRGRVGGDAADLAAVLSHYLEAGGVETATSEDVRESLVAALASATTPEEAVAALLIELRRLAVLARLAGAEQAEAMWQRAAGAGSGVTESVMAGLLGCRGTPPALVGGIDVVTTFVDRIPDADLAEFLVRAATPVMSRELPDLFVALAPDAARRRRALDLVRALVGEGLEEGFLDRWTELERELETLSDRRFVSDEYASTLRDARTRAADKVGGMADPPEIVVAWLASVGDVAVEEMDRRLLADLARMATAAQGPKVIEILRSETLAAAAGGDWGKVSDLSETIAAAVPEPSEPASARAARAALQSLAESPAVEPALEAAAEEDSAFCADAARFLRALGSVMINRLAQRSAAETRPAARAHLERLVASFGREAGEGLRPLLRADDVGLRAEAARLLSIAAPVEYLAALEPLLADESARVQAEALRALENARSDRAADIIARGIAKAGPVRQAALVERLAGSESPRAVAIFRALLAQLDQRTVASRVYVAIIQALGRLGTEEAAGALGLVFDRLSWASPLRAARFRTAAVAALQAMTGPAAASVLGRASLFKGRRRASPAAGLPAGPGGTDGGGGARR